MLQCELRDDLESTKFKHYKHCSYYIVYVIAIVCIMFDSIVVKIISDFYQVFIHCDHDAYRVK